MLAYVFGEGVKDRMRRATLICCHRYAFMETGDCAADGTGDFIGVGLDPPRVLLLKFIDRLQFAQSFGFLWFGGGFVVQERFEFGLFAKQPTRSFDVVKAVAALLDA